MELKRYLVCGTFCVESIRNGDYRNLYFGSDDYDTAAQRMMDLHKEILSKAGFVVYDSFADAICDKTPQILQMLQER